MIITYRATGVFNIAQGAIAMISAYLFWQLVAVWGVPKLAAAVHRSVRVSRRPFGVLVQRIVFRPLQRREAAPAESLVATIGLTVLLIGIAYKVWGAQAHNAVDLLPQAVWQVGSITIHSDSISDLAIVIVGTIGLGVIAAGVPRSAPRSERSSTVATSPSSQASTPTGSPAIGWCIGTLRRGTDRDPARSRRSSSRRSA